MAEAKSRQEALSALAKQNDAPKVERPEAPAPSFDDGTVDAGGNVSVGVLIDSYVIKHAKEARYLTIRKGQVAKVTAEQADRAEAHNWVTRL